MAELTIIVPTFNEEKVVESFYGQLNDVLEKSGISYEVLFVNDGSTDNTKSILDSLKAKVIHLQRNHGYGGAIKIGIRNSNSDILAIIDCDGTYNPSDLVDLYQNIAHSADYTKVEVSFVRPIGPLTTRVAQ